jgi:hypothetical protein
MFQDTTILAVFFRDHDPYMDEIVGRKRHIKHLCVGYNGNFTSLFLFLSAFTCLLVPENSSKNGELSQNKKIGRKYCSTSFKI